MWTKDQNDGTQVQESAGEYIENRSKQGRRDLEVFEAPSPNFEKNISDRITL